MKESLSAIPKQPVFRETFTDEQTTRLNGGVPTAVTYFNGVASFNGSTSNASYNKTYKGTYSVRLKYTSFTLGTNAYLVDFRGAGASGVGYLYQNAVSVLFNDSGTTYVNGIATAVVSTNTTEIILTGLVLSGSILQNLNGRYDGASRSTNTLELVEIYDYTLTANEVKNLYEGKRNRIIDLKQTATSIDNYYQGVGVAGNYVSTPDAAANQITGDIEIIAKINLNNNSSTNPVITKNNFTSGGIAAIAYSFYINSTNFPSLETYVGSYTDSTSTVAISSSYNGWLKVTRVASTGIVQFFTSSDGIIYTQLGANKTTPIGNLTNINYPVNIGYFSTNGVTAFRGIIYRATISNSIGGTPVVDFNPQLYVGGTTLPSSTGETWTINGTQGFIGNGSRPEILNIDGRNGVIANKYSNQPLLPNLASGYNITNWTTTGTAVLVNATTFNLPLAGDTVYKSFGQASKYLRIRIQGTTTGSVLVKSGDGSIVLSPNLTGTFDLNTDVVWSANGNVVFYAAIAGITTITNFTIQELIPNIVNTAVTPVRQGSVWGMNAGGSTSKLDCGNYDSLLGDISLISWFNIRSFGGGGAGRIIDNGNFQIFIYSTGYLIINSNGSTSAASGVTIKKGVNYQLIVTRTSTGATNIYLNGILNGSANQSSGTPVAGSNNIILFNSNNNVYWLDGRLSQIRIIKGILNAQECQQLFDNERHDYGI